MGGGRGCPREPVIAAYGRNGQKVLLHLMSGSKEDTETGQHVYDRVRHFLFRQHKV
jgi:hypothetical protein